MPRAPLCGPQLLAVPVTPGTARIEELLRSHESFAEDLFSTLLDQLGFRQATQALT